MHMFRARSSCPPLLWWLHSTMHYLWCLGLKHSWNAVTCMTHCVDMSLQHPWLIKFVAYKLCQPLHEGLPGTSGGAQSACTCASLLRPTSQQPLHITPQSLPKKASIVSQGIKSMSACQVKGWPITSVPSAPAPQHQSSYHLLTLCN